ncbi:MAG: beta-lactamase family protein [Labilithrix sp.]|nr:beta-lactamase family protein [Labilithrix sp.]MCW5810763.1 beta-lactamase family protein [Labilithrix sp.]
MKSIAAIASVVLLVTGCTAASSDVATDTNAIEAEDACAAEEARFGAALSQIPHESWDLVMQTKTACGSTFHTVGPSQLDEHRLVRIGSVTKSYVSVVVLRLVDEGKIELDARLDTYLPDAPAFAASATVRQLLQHTSGIPNYTATTAFWHSLATSPGHAYTEQELLAFVATQPADFAPGTGWRYSNTNYLLAGMLIEKVDGQPIAASIRERILVPNGLNETFFDGEENVTGLLAPGFNKHGVDVTAHHDPSWAWAAGAMVASPPDMARFVELLGSGALLSPKLQAELTKPVATPQPGLSYGLGVFLTAGELTGGLGPAIGHGGDIMGYHSWGLYFPERKATVFGTVMSDRGNGNSILVAAITALTAS